MCDPDRDEYGSQSPLSDVRTIDLPQVTDDRGALTYVEAREHVPIDINRVYYIYDVPESQSRGAHAHRELEQVLIALNGSFDLVLDDGVESERYALDEPDEGVYLPGMLWRDMENFTPGTVCLVLASDPYDEADYIRDYDEYLELARTRQGPE